MSATGLRWTTVDAGPSDGAIDRVVRLAHRTGWGRMHRMSVDEVRDHLGPLPSPLGRLVYGRPTKVEVAPLSLPTRAGSVAARVYRGGAHPRAPLVVFFHGGGFVAGDLESHDHICRRLAVRAQAVVVAVDYRRAPEHPYPAAVEDCADAVRAVVGQARALGAHPARLVLCGDSAGGNLSASTALLLHDEGEGPPIARLLLAYPAADGTLGADSLRTHADGALLCTADVERFHQHYLSGDQREPTARYFSLLQVDDLAMLPPTSIALAGRDPIRDDGAALAHKLVQHGVDVEVTEYPRSVHGYWLLPGISPAARHTTAWFAAAIQRSRAPSPA